MNKLDEITLRYKDYFNDIKDKALKYHEEHKNIVNKNKHITEYICECFSSNSEEENVTYTVYGGSVKLTYANPEPFFEVMLSSNNLTRRGTTFLPEKIVLRKEVNNKKILYSFYDDDAIVIEINLNNSFKTEIFIPDNKQVFIRYPNKSNSEYIFTTEEKNLINQLNFVKELLLTDKKSTLNLLLGDKKLSLEDKENYELINDCDIRIVEDLIFDKSLSKKNKIKRNKRVIK